MIQCCTYYFSLFLCFDKSIARLFVWTNTGLLICTLYLMAMFYAPTHQTFLSSVTRGLAKPASISIFVTAIKQKTLCARSLTFLRATRGTADGSHPVSANVFTELLSLRAQHWFVPDCRSWHYVVSDLSLNLTVILQKRKKMTTRFNRGAFGTFWGFISIVHILQLEQKILTVYKAM